MPITGIQFKQNFPIFHPVCFGYRKHGNMTHKNLRNISNLIRGTSRSCKTPFYRHPTATKSWLYLRSFLVHDWPRKCFKFASFAEIHNVQKLCYRSEHTTKVICVWWITCFGLIHVTKISPSNRDQCNNISLF